MLFAGQSAVVVGHGVQVKVLHEAVQADGHLRAPRKVVVVHGVIHNEKFAGEPEPFGHLRFGDGVDPFAEVIEFEHLYVGAEGGRTRW